MPDMTQFRPESRDSVKERFLRATGITDHPFSRTPEPCCDADPSRHLGYGDIPWTLPDEPEMERLLND